MLREIIFWKIHFDGLKLELQVKFLMKIFTKLLGDLLYSSMVELTKNNEIFLQRFCNVCLCRNEQEIYLNFSILLLKCR